MMKLAPSTTRCKNFTCSQHTTCLRWLRRSDPNTASKETFKKDGYCGAFISGELR